MNTILYLVAAATQREHAWFTSQYRYHTNTRGSFHTTDARQTRV